MLKSKAKPRRLGAVVALCTLILFGSAHAKSSQTVAPQPHQVDVVIALDVSNSMDGLIGSAKQRLWDVVNELGRAQPHPELRIAILSFGNPNYGNKTGFVRIDLPFTSDLDAVNKALFELSTNGGDEYVARVVDTALKDLNWSSAPGALRVLFVAGNEAANQDPQIPLLLAANAAAGMGITVNTIYCGNETDGDAAGWRQAAAATNGLFASINQDTGAVANISTPMDDELAELNKQLNDTYVAYGANGASARANQVEQDSVVAEMSAPAMASRAATKAGALYRNDSWDLVDAVKSGKSLADVADEELPDEMLAMAAEERAGYVEEKTKKREEIQERIQSLAEQRRDYIQTERDKLAESDGKGLDEVMQTGLRSLAEEKGFAFDATE